MDLENTEQMVQQGPPKVKRIKPNILITGTPGTGKTTISKLLVEYLSGLQYVAVGELVLQQKLYKSWNQEFDCPEFDDDMVCDYLEPVMAQEGIVIDFHSSGFFPERWFDLVVLLRTDNSVLYDRLFSRGYNEKKIMENLECEILEVVAEEVYDSYKKEIIIELRNEKPEDVEANLMKIIEWLKNWS